MRFLEDVYFEGEVDFENIKNIYIFRKSILFIFFDFLFEGVVEVLKVFFVRCFFVCCC